jgi:hypothetical protein
VKSQLGITTDYDDDLINDSITAARQECETRANMSFIATTWELTLHHFPPYTWSFGSGRSGGLWAGYPGNTSGVIRLPFGPLIEVNSIQYLATTGAELSLSVTPSDGQTRISPGWPGEIAPAYGSIWPVCQPTIGAVVINYTAGFGSDATLVPATIKKAILMLSAYFYEVRTGDEPEPPAIESLIDSAYPGGFL